MSASWAAARNGSQWSLWNDGRPSRCGASVKVIALAPLAAVRSTSATEACTSQKGTITIGMNRSGAAADHSSRMKSFQATTHAAASSLSSAEKNVPPAKPGKDGKAHLSVHPVEIHVGKSGGDVVATREHLVEADRVDAEVLGVLAGHGIEPDGRDDLALETPGLRPALEFHDVRADLEVLGREPIEPHPLVLNHVVVNRDHLDVFVQHVEPPGTRSHPTGKNRHVLTI